METYLCNKCGQPSYVADGAEFLCTKCGGIRGHILMREQVKEMSEAGALFTYDSKGRRRKIGYNPKDKYKPLR